MLYVIEDSLTKACDETLFQNLINYTDGLLDTG